MGCPSGFDDRLEPVMGIRRRNERLNGHQRQNLAELFGQLSDGLSAFGDWMIPSIFVEPSEFAFG